MKRLFHARWFRRSLIYLPLAAVIFAVVTVVRVWDETELVSPTATPLFEDRHGVFLAEGEGDRLGFWAIEEALPERLVAGLIAVEDCRFYSHGGVDVRSLARVVVHNSRGGALQGASTLAMQVARMQGNHARTYANKFDELVTGWLLVHRHGRDAVLRHYLRIVPQGNRIHGVKYAARRYFRKPLQDLSWAEASVLAALPKAPGRMNLHTHKGRKAAAKRAARILGLLLEDNRIEIHDYNRALDQLAQLSIPVREVRPSNAYHAILRLQEQAEGQSWNGPLRTSLDMNVQERVQDMAWQTIQRYRTQGAGNIACVVAERESGRIVAYLGSDAYDDDRYSGSIDYAATARSSGSTLKPFIYALGLEQGKFTPASVLSDLPLHITHAGGHYTAANYDHSYLGPLLYRKALANSRNIPAIHVLKQVGVRATLEKLRAMDLDHSDHKAEHYGLGLAIGGMYVTLTDLVRAYGVLANDGRAFDLAWFDGQHPQTQEQHFSSATARRIATFLADPQARLPSFTGTLEFPFPVAVKTGTSQGFRDAWAVGFSDRYLVGVWMGHPDHQRMNRIGGVSSAGLLRRILTYLQPQTSRGLGESRFPAPEGYRPVRLCPLSGEPASAWCSGEVTEYFAPNQAPVTENKIHRVFAIDSLTGLKASRGTPTERIALKPFVVLPDIYASWARSRGFPQPPRAESAPTIPKLSITSPASGSRLHLDPDTPLDYQSLALKATVTPAVSEVVWYVDGQPYRRATYPYTVRWPMKAGTHVFQVGFPNAEITSQPISLDITGQKPIKSLAWNEERK